MAQSKSIYFQCVHTQECTQNEHGQGNPCWMEQLWLPQPSSIKRSSDRCRRQYFAHCWVKGYWKGKLHVIWARPLFPVKESQKSPSETSQGSTTLKRYCLLLISKSTLTLATTCKNETVQQKECEGKRMNEAPHNNHSHALKMPTCSCNNLSPQYQCHSLSCKTQLMWQMISLNSNRFLKYTQATR